MDTNMLWVGLALGWVVGAVTAAELADVVETAEPERIATGFKFTEGPLWHPGGYLLFSDIPENRIVKWTPGGQVTTFRSPSGNSNGLTFDRQGRLLACEHGNRRVSRAEPDGRVVALAERFDGKRLNSPNDIVVKADGAIYFTDPPYGVKPEQRELTFQGVYRIASEGKLTLLVDDFDKPNGLAFSPDEKVLYIADTARKHVRAFEVRPDGTLANGRVFAELKSDKPGAPDGMKVDERGNLYVTGPGGTWVFDPTGRHLGTIVTAEVPANCAFGGPDRRTLFITARTSVYRVRVKTPGMRVF
ncbi:MAG: SMP-30/gluconolactonase/LRE family protein [Planctomycetes bacterium]|nr:SMP-30/gluconolactonase/LRE family protein [Planctomycetota bacterium]MBM4080241.1 SMP-30/gluconolactonase/LRE family protein [Planctomycetota bacterium]